LPVGVTLPSRNPVMLLIVSVVCGFCFVIICVYIVDTYKLFCA
jgi:hypothetical protein